MTISSKDYPQYVIVTYPTGRKSETKCNNQAELRQVRIDAEKMAKIDGFSFKISKTPLREV